MDGACIKLHYFLGFIFVSSESHFSVFQDALFKQSGANLIRAGEVAPLLCGRASTEVQDPPQAINASA
jgi:hypothetical protein